MKVRPPKLDPITTQDVERILALSTELLDLADRLLASGFVGPSGLAASAGEATALAGKEVTVGLTNMIRRMTEDDGQ